MAFIVVHGPTSGGKSGGVWGSVRAHPPAGLPVRGYGRGGGANTWNTV